MRMISKSQEFRQKAGPPLFTKSGPGARPSSKDDQPGKIDMSYLEFDTENQRIDKAARFAVKLGHNPSLRDASHKKTRYRHEGFGYETDALTKMNAIYDPKINIDAYLLHLQEQTQERQRGAKKQMSKQISLSKKAKRANPYLQLENQDEEATEAVFKSESSLSRHSYASAQNFNHHTD